MASCWYCESFVEDATAACEFCGAATPGSKPKWIMMLDALPASQDQLPHFGRWYVAWEIILVTLGLLYWPWWAALGAVFIGLFLAVPATMITLVLAQQAARLWLAARPRLLRPSPHRGLFALEEQTRERLHTDQEAFDTLVGIMYRERRHRDLMPEASVVEYRKHKVLPVFGKMVRLSASALLEMEVRRLINQCERICDGAEGCEHQELNRRYDRLESMQHALVAIKKRWSEYIQTHVATPEFALTSGPSTDSFDAQLPPDSMLLAPEDIARLRGARDTLHHLRHVLHQTQELRLLATARPLAGYEANARTEGTPLHGVSTLLKQIQASDRLSALECEYQRIVAEQRTIQDTAGGPGAARAALHMGAPLEGDDCENRIDAPAILSNSLPRQ